MFLRDVMVREARFIQNRKPSDEVSSWPGEANFTVDDVLGVLDKGREPQGSSHITP
jgi:hypothetical protein